MLQQAEPARRKSLSHNDLHTLARTVPSAKVFLLARTMPTAHKRKMKKSENKPCFE